MAGLLSVTAFRTSDPAALSAAICRYAAEREVACTTVRVSDEFASNILIFSARGGWSVVFWPDAFVGIDLQLVQHLSRELQLLASLVFVAEGGAWAHVLLQRGAVLDCFSPQPSKLTGPGLAVLVAAHSWSGDAAVLARAFGVETSTIAPYLRDLDKELAALQPQPSGFWARFWARLAPPEAPPFRPGRALPDDEYDLDDMLVFVDFWRRIGIHYPAEMELASPAYVWRFGGDCAEKLRAPAPMSEKTTHYVESLNTPGVSASRIGRAEP